MKLVQKSRQAGTIPTANLYSEVYIPQKMPRILNSWDMTTTFVVSTYLASCASTIAAGGPAAMTYLLLVGVTFFVPCLIATAQLSQMYPHEGGLYNWVYHAIGGYWSFFAGFCAWFPGVLISGSLANLFVVYATPLINPAWLAQPWQQSIATCLVLAVSGMLTLCHFRWLQNLINLLVILMFMGTLLIAVACILWLVRGHHSATIFTNWTNWRPGTDNVVMFGLVAFAYLGTESPLNLAGEFTGRSVIKRHLIWGGILLVLIYISNTMAVLIVLGPRAAYDPFALVNTVAIVLGKGYASATTVCLMASFLATILVYNYLYARLLFVASIDKRLPQGLSKLNRWHVPGNAAVVQTTLAMIITLLLFNLAPFLNLAHTASGIAAQIYAVSQASASLVWAVSAAFLFISIILCYTKNPHSFISQRHFSLPVIWISVVAGLLSCGVMLIDTLLFSWTNLLPDSQWVYLVGGLTIILLALTTFISIFARSEVDWQILNKDVIEFTTNRPAKATGDAPISQGKSPV
ncbi:hypothetical protein KDA_32770 [Dictyobacter alpinus]|uniref:Amino acid permease n=1 Tax=Dictyobacter alpinus TaxID=2014873 RepID=A0A402B8Q8_9CHLR|nr:APC family permease [Dictyobacter alpinus]GCE27793.1 hypothetical protein KDA_32770 [Dictyobacter alpinus]